MNLEYFELTCYGNIQKCSIDTSSDKYVSNDGKKVKIIDSFYDMYGDLRTGEIEHFINFEDARLERVKSYELEIARYQKELEVFKNAKNYEHYNQLHKENIKNS
jgi:hypothetical protein